MVEKIRQLEDETNVFVDKLMQPELWMNMGWVICKILLIIILAVIINRLGRSAVANALKMKSRTSIKVSPRRETTLVKLLQNLVSYVVYFIAFITILATLTIDIKGIIAGAGFLGLAVGFGSQNLVKDIIAGFFIIFEDQFSVGDHVSINQFHGTVDEIGIRTTKILNWKGELYIVPNGNITHVTNFSIYKNKAVVDVPITYSGNLDKLIRDMEHSLQSLTEKHEEMMSVPKVLGLEHIDGDQMTLRIIADTAPGNSEKITRVLRHELKTFIDAFLKEKEIRNNHQGE